MWWDVIKNAMPIGHNCKSLIILITLFFTTVITCNYTQKIGGVFVVLSLLLLF